MAVVLYTTRDERGREVVEVVERRDPWRRLRRVARVASEDDLGPRCPCLAVDGLHVWECCLVLPASQHFPAYALCL